MFDEFQKGQLEDSQVPTPHYNEVVAAAAAGDYVYVKRPMYNLRHYGLNTRVKPLNDRPGAPGHRQRHRPRQDPQPDLRRALHPGPGILPPGTLGFNPALNAPGWDTRRARDLLAQAGYPGGARAAAAHVLVGA